MSEIVKVPDERLKKSSLEIKDFNDELKKLTLDLFETMRANRGAGLAAPQIGVNLRVAVIGTPYNYAIINPKITKRIGSYSSLEGCLSIPGVRKSVRRSKVIHLEYYTENGERVSRIVSNTHEATVLQHEIDHLNGILITDWGKT